MEAAAYLDPILGSCGVADVEHDCGLWAWLALFYFDALCPVRRNNRREPGQIARWIPEVNNYLRYYRHLLAGPYRIYRAHRDDPQRARALLCGPVSNPGEVVEQFASRQELVTNPTVVECLARLYYDPAAGRLRRGSGGSTEGSARRLADVLGQFDVTWDLRALGVERLVCLLPGEFDRFRALPGPEVTP
jgi:hypothetical protein